MSFRSAHRSPYIERALTKAGHAPRVSSALLGLVLALSALGCRKPAPSATESKPAETATAAPTAAPAPSSTAPLYRPPPVLGHRDAVGPDLVILPGTGVGAIRFGTNLTKLQQLMEGPCDVLTETRCGYIRAASEFTLDAGVVTGMKFHRRDRRAPGAPASGDQYYGSFNGGMRPGLMFGLLREVVLKEFAVPDKTEPLTGPDGQLQRDFYPGVILEYDRLANQKVVLSGIEVIRAETVSVKPAAAPSTPAAAPSKPAAAQK